MSRIFQPALDLLQSETLLKGLGGAAGHAEWYVVNTLEEAGALAWHADDSVEEVWNDLREHETANIVFDGEGEVWDYWESELSPRFDAYLSERGWGDLSDDVLGDLYYICCNLHFKCGHRLWDLMLAVYSAGGWPCGWVDGQYPQGRLAVFSAES